MHLTNSPSFCFLMQLAEAWRDGHRWARMSLLGLEVDQLSLKLLQERRVG